MSAANLSEAEALAARMFFDVTMQAAFALEDPNSRFAVVFEHKEAMGPKVDTLAEVPHGTYETTAGGMSVLFEARPKDSPALSRVLIQGGIRPALIRFLDGAMEKVEYFTVHYLGGADPIKEPPSDPDSIGNVMFRLAIKPELETVHDVAVMFAWGLTSDKGTMMELSAWPIDKETEAEA